MADSTPRNLPKICVVTPSYNQGQYLEQTMLSVLDQGYPNLEYIVMDGGSTDTSPAIIQKYAGRLHHWQSQADKGQTDAIQNGFAKSDAEILAWLNSDDLYEQGTLLRVGRFFADHPDAVLVYGDYYVMDESGQKQLKPKISFDFKICLHAYLMIPQPAAFWRRSAYEAVQGLDARLHYAMDWDFFLRVGQHFPRQIKHLPEPLATFRLHEVSKSVSAVAKFKEEHKLIRSKFGLQPRWQRKLKKYFHLLRTEFRFATERGIIPLKKDRRKA